MKLSVCMCFCVSVGNSHLLKVIKRGFRISFPLKLEIWDLNILGPRKEKDRVMVLIHSPGETRKT